MAGHILESDEKDHRSVLASIDKEGRRKNLIVAIVPGFWRRCRVAVALVLIAFYMAAPLIHVGGMPMVRIDIPNRHYIFMGHIFWPQDFFYFLLLFLTGIIATVALVSLLGRVFCGWICPHNVFLEIIYRPIERFFEGPAHRHRLRNQRRELTTSERARRVGKWIAYALVSGALANTATALFVGTDAFLYGLIIDPISHPAAATFFAFAFVIIHGNFVWFREQTCTIICPYGRLQSALLDSESLIVGYDPRRGEPRGKATVATNGDCIDCNLCVDVCPTGIDIRNGTQMECIQCSACIDACDSVMRKLERPINLISYTSENALQGLRHRFLRPRTLLYGFVLLLLVSLTSVAIAQRPLFQLSRMRDAPPLSSITTSDGQTLVTMVVNVAIINKTPHDALASYTLPDNSQAEVVSFGPQLALPANARSLHTFRILVPAEALRDRGYETTIRLEIPNWGRPLLIPVRLPQRRPASESPI
ncbi:MAG: cytochrome c oxidase accessory protein CcoG [Planctomycetota bacterium]|nr:MAG: cytochrome c oxidase accessory protein CcoG [Planctomycetota bacterium]